MPKSSAKAQKVADGGLPPGGGVVDVVIGSTNGVGVRLTRKLVEMGHEVRAVMFEKPADERWAGLPHGIRPFIVDITFKNPDDKKHLLEACSGADNIFHLSAATERSEYTFDDYIAINVVGTENILQTCVDANGTKPVRFVYLSTTSIYGNSREGEVLTEESQTLPSRPFTETKLMAEQVVKAFQEANPSIKYTIVRCSTIYGPGYDRSIFKLFKYLEEQKMRYVGKGNNHLSMVHVDDVVQGMILATEKPAAINQTYNLSDGKTYTAKELMEYAAFLLHVLPPTRSINPTLVRFMHKLLTKAEIEFLLSDRVVSTEKIRRELGFKPTESIEKAGSQILERYKT